MKTFLSLILLVANTFCIAQPVLLPHIGLISEPSVSDPICPIPNYLGDYESSGIQEGDTCADFTLYNTYGDAFHLGEVLASGKPVLMISGSYTCPVFRNKISVINQVIQEFGNDLEVIVVYGIEAHPYGDISPYFGFENPGQANLNLGILFPQPTTYGERLAIGDSLFANSSIDPSIVYFEGPCQAWWDFYGPAPQNSYIVDTTGIVYSKHGWFDKHPDDIFCDLQQYFGLPETDCDEILEGTFYLNHLDSIEDGIAGETLYPGVDLVNNSQEDALVEVRRMVEDIPADWETSMCITACLLADQSIDTVLIPTGVIQPFTIDFHTSEIANSGRVRMRFKNVYDPQNVFVQAFYGNTSGVGIVENEIERLDVFPNPAIDHINIPALADKANVAVQITDIYGRHVSNQTVTGSRLEIDLIPGIYILSVTEENRLIGSARFVVLGN